jgi:hypothetical protein
MTAEIQKLTKEKEKIELECLTIKKENEKSKQSNNDINKQLKQTQNNLDSV